MRSETIPSSRITPDLQIHSFFSSVHLIHLLQGSDQRTPDTRSETIPSSRITPDLQIHSFSSSVHLTHLLQGSGQRTPDTRSETIPSSRITPDLQIHSFFSSVHLTHLLQGSGQRTPDTRSETIPSSRITPDLQIHSFFSSVHSLIFYRVQIREHLTRDQRPFLPPESLQIFRFTASSLQFTHSSSTGFRTENTWPEIRDHSFIQNHSRSSDSQLLLFSSLTHLLQGSDQRTPDTRSETIPSSRITPDRQIHSFFSSVHSLIFYRVQIREHLTRDQIPFLHPESLQIFRFTASSLQFTSLIFYRVQIREHLTQDQRPFLHPESLQIFRFTASPLQFTHSSSTGFRSENTWHEIRDHSFIQNHSRSSDSQLLLFSSLIFYRVQIREHLTRDQRPFLHPESLQIFRFTASPLQFTSLLFYRVQVREHLTWDQRPFLHPESLQIFRFTASSLQFTSFIFYRVQIREHLTRDQRPFLHPESLQIFRFTASPLQFTSLIFYRVQVREHLTRDQRQFLHPESLQIFRFTASSLQFTSLIFYRVQVREHLTRDQRPFLHPESLQIFRFTASSLQFTHSSSTGFRSENTWHEIRDHSFLQNHSRSSDSQLLLFSSLTHLLQGSEQRTPDPRSETIPSSRITPDLQIHSFFSSVHSLIFYRVQIREHLTRDQRPFLHPESLQIVRFTASSLQFTHSSSTGFRSENTWHEIRDHSFIQNHSRSSDSQLLLFSSPHSSSTGFRSENTWHKIRDHSFIQNHSRSSDSQLLLFSSLTHLLQGSDQRTLDTRSETIPSSRITPDLQIHSFSSSVHLTHLLQGSGQRTPDTRSETIPSSRITPDLQIHSFSSSVHLTHLLQGSGQRTPDTRSETIPSSRITPDLQIHSFSSSVHSLIFYRLQSENTWHEIRDLHPESLQIFRFTASSLQFTSLIFYRVQVREHLTRDQRPFLHPESLQIFRFTASPLQFTSLIFYRVQVREHLTRDQRPFLHPESLQIFRFTASPLQFTHSSSTGFRSENTWHEIRDHSFIQNHSRSSDSQLLLFSSLTHLLQGSDQRTPNTRSESIPSSRITPDLHIHSFFSSVHSLIFYRVQIREHLTRDQRPFLHPESLQIFRFTASPLQFTHSSSTGFRSENTWHEIRDLHPESLQIFRFTASSLQFTSLIFYRVQVREHLTRDQRPFLHPESLQIFRFTGFSSSVHLTHLLQGSGQRTPDTRSETIPSSRITPDLQIHSFSSSVHSLIFYRVQVREHLTRDQRPFLHPESLQIFRFTASPLQFTHSSSTGFRSENT